MGNRESGKGAWWSYCVYQGEPQVLGPFYRTGIRPDPLAEQEANEVGMDKMPAGFEVVWLPTIDESRATSFLKGKRTMESNLATAKVKFKHFHDDEVPLKGKAHKGATGEPSIRLNPKVSKILDGDLGNSDLV